MRLISTLSIFYLVLISASPAAAAGFVNIGREAYTWEGIFAGGRLSSLGGADLADSSPAALLFNPAPLSQGNGVALGYDHADYFAEAQFHTYGGAAEVSAWRLNVAVQDYDFGPIRTAYDPEGLNTPELNQRMMVIGLSHDLGRSLLGNPDLSWSVGAAWRQYSSSLITTSFGETTETEDSDDSLDLGTTLGWRARFEGGWAGVTGVVSWQNATGATAGPDSASYHMPQPLRTGLTMEFAFERSGHDDDLAKIMLAYTRAFQLGDTSRDDSNHIGVELLLLDALALRWGHNDRMAGDVTSVGVGIVLDERLLGPFTVEADLGQVRYNHELFGDDDTIWGARARYAF